MKNITRCQKIIWLMLIAFLIGMLILFVKIQFEASYYIVNSNSKSLGYVYDRNGDILFDINADYDEKYSYGHFRDVGNIIGDAQGQATNTLVARNVEKLNNYSFTQGINFSDGQACIYTTLNHEANQKVYDAFGSKDGCAIAYNYITGEILVCVSKPSVDVVLGYEDLKQGSLLCKNFIKTVPGSTQKVSTLISALEHYGWNTLSTMEYTCNGIYTNQSNTDIKCHNLDGHGTENIIEAFENSCNPFFAQLVEDKSFGLDSIIKTYKNMGYSINDEESTTFLINGIKVQTASTTLKNASDFNTQWGCIGQGETMISPCQLMMWQSAIANGTGRATYPYLIDYVLNVNGKKYDEAITDYTNTLFSSVTANKVREIMLTNGEDKYSKSIPDFKVGVKSGTAQVDNGEKENSLLVGFDADTNHPIAFCIVIEDKNNGDYVSTESIANTILYNLD
ncbi:MAG: penicillin-binding transpeptidase domain-containing protein [Oscillospiraceae bacterium]